MNKELEKENREIVASLLKALAGLPMEDALSLLERARTEVRDSWPTKIRLLARSILAVLL